MLIPWACLQASMQDAAKDRGFTYCLCVQGLRKGPANDSAQELGDVIIDIPQASATSK